MDTDKPIIALYCYGLFGLLDEMNSFLEAEIQTQVMSNTW